MDIFLLYLFTRVDSFHMACVLVLFGICVFVMFSLMSADMGWGDTDEQKSEKFKKARKPLVFAIPLIALLVIVPSQKDLAIILAGSAVLDVARSETAGRLASKSVQLIEQTLDGYLKKPEPTK